MIYKKLVILYEYRYCNEKNGQNPALLRNITTILASFGRQM